MSSIPSLIFLLMIVGLAEAQLAVKQESTASNAMSNMQFRNALQRALNDLQKLRPEAYHYSGAKKGFLSVYNFPQYPYKVEKSAGSTLSDLTDNEERVVQNSARLKRYLKQVLDGEELSESKDKGLKHSCWELPSKIETEPVTESEQKPNGPNGDDTINNASAKVKESRLSSELLKPETRGKRRKKDTSNDDHLRARVIKLSKRQPRKQMNHNQSAGRTKINGNSSNHQVRRLPPKGQPFLAARGRSAQAVKDSQFIDGSRKEDNISQPTRKSLPKTHRVNIRVEKSTATIKDFTEERVLKRGKRDVPTIPEDQRSSSTTDEYTDRKEYDDNVRIPSSTNSHPSNQDQGVGSEDDAGEPKVEGADPARRFLFSPSITNTITNLNQNTNTNTNVIHHTPGTIGEGLPARPKWSPKKPKYQPVVPYPFFGPNPFGDQRKSSKRIDKEFDLRGTGLKKVCFLL